MKKFGTYSAPYHPNPFSKSMDVGECQTFLPKGERIRNKKAKRRAHNKTTRQAAGRDLRKESQSAY
jgi:hypothetical protein